MSLKAKAEAAGGVLAALRLVAGWKGYALAGGLSLAVGGAGGFFGGWTLRGWKADHDAAPQIRADFAASVRALGQADRSAAVTLGVGEAVEAGRARTRERVRTITERIPVYVTAAADARCDVSAGFVRAHDAAAAGVDLPTIPEAGGGAPGAPSGVALSAVAGVVNANYGVCHDNADTVSAWQAWWRDQAAIFGAAPAVPVP